MNTVLMTDIPIYTADKLAKAIRDVIYWRRHQPITRQDRIDRDHAYIRLDQASAQLDLVLKRFTT